MQLRTVCALLSAIFLLSSCDSISDLFASKDKPAFPGKRINVLDEYQAIKPDDSLNDTAITVPDVKANENWRQAGGSPQGITGNLQLSGFKEHDKITIGKGYEWDQPLYSSPIVADGTVYAMDAMGYITAHDASNIDKIKWRSKSLVDKNRPDVLGGGLAYDNGRLFATSGRGSLYAIDTTNGKELWRQFVGIPLRAAPKASNGKVYVVSVDNQMFAFDAERGTQLWSHRGINENAGFLAEVSPAVNDALVIAPYSSGEIHALDSISGQDLWNNSLLKPDRTSATADFSGIAGTPIIKDDTVYAAGSNGYIGAFSLLNGRPLWQQDISSLNAPWIAGDFIYMLSTDNQLVCIYKPDGRIKWVRQMPSYRNAKKHKDPYTWMGPIMASGQLLLAEPGGSMLVLSAKDGSTITTVDIPENITVPPVIADGRMYVVTKNAKLHVLY